MAATLLQVELLSISCAIEINTCEYSKGVWSDLTKTVSNQGSFLFPN